MSTTKYPSQIKRAVFRGETCVKVKTPSLPSSSLFWRSYFLLFKNKWSTLCVKGQRRQRRWSTSDSVPPPYENLF